MYWAVINTNVKLLFFFVDYLLSEWYGKAAKSTGGRRGINSLDILGSCRIHAHRVANLFEAET